MSYRDSAYCDLCVDLSLHRDLVDGHSTMKPSWLTIESPEMKNILTKVAYCLVCFVALQVTGCGGGGNTVVEAPQMTAEEQAALEKRQAEYSKSMQEAYGKSKGN